MSLFAPKNPVRQKAINTALRYLGYRSRSTREMTDYLARKNTPEDIIHQTMAYLKQHRYLDDAVFARQFVRSRKKNNPKSRFALRHELREKGISARNIDEALAGIDDHEMACLAVRSRYARWEHLKPDRMESKVMNFLRYRGFSHAACRSAWELVCKLRAAEP